jgi:PQQ-dependent dehydrogenase (methanol/ethanol family)
MILVAGALCVQAQENEKASEIFASRCAGCHGADGAGGEHGPSIVEGRRAAASNRQALAGIIRNGIKDGSMPAFTFSDAEMSALVELLEALRSPAADHPTTGDPAAGQIVFFGKGNCSQCHMLRGYGGILGPDLTNLARQRRLSQIQQALQHPETLTASGFRPMTVQLRGGHSLSGIVKNESNYDLQLQSADGSLRLLSKSEIESATREPKSLMPAVSAAPREMRDLLAFLTRLTSDNPIHVPETALKGSTGVSFDEIVHPKPGDWPTYHGQIGGNRHIELTQIDTSNVAHLAPAWMFPVANAKRLEVTPVVIGGIMYVTNANECYAVDARSGRQIWHYGRPLTKGVIGDAESGINRGVAVLGDRVFMTTDNAHIIALSRITGQLLWDTEIADFRQHYGTTSAPLVVNDLVLSGTSGGDEGARGFVDAYRAATGERVWRFWNMPARGEPGSETWVGRAIEHGCVDGWLTGTFDLTLNTIYWPTGNPCPDYNGDERKGDNLYANSVVALDPANGKLRWYFQFTPHDLHDWDAVQPLLSVDTQFHGLPRKLLLQANRNGFFYVLDRVTGEFLLGRPFVKKMDWADGLDAKGRPQVRESSVPTPQGTKTCPSVEGATNWFSSAYNPATALFYVMAKESCNIYTKSDAWWEPGKSFYGGGTRRVPGETRERFLRALDIQTGKVVWEIPQISGGPGGDDGWGGILSTAGGLIFFCDDSGAFAAADAKSGKLLWHFHTNQKWHASPMAYAVDGNEYVAVAAGSNIIAFALR